MTRGLAEEKSRESHWDLYYQCEGQRDEIRSGTDRCLLCVTTRTIGPDFSSVFFLITAAVPLGSSDQLHCAGPTLMDQLQYPALHPTVPCLSSASRLTGALQRPLGSKTDSV